jgi:hypothetical protein
MLTKALSARWNPRPGYDWWRCTFHYGPDVRWPKRPGDIAIQTVHATESSRDIEIEAGRQRADIAEIVVEQWGGTGWLRWDGPR